MTQKMLAEAEIFRVAKGLGMAPSQARTLAYCLYWSQMASHSQVHGPCIWKTGQEIGDALGMGPRTANSHLKNLAERGFWTIHYAPRPRGISKVTWLTFTQRSLDLLDLTRELVKTPKNKKGPTVVGSVSAHSNVQKTNLQKLQNATSSQTYFIDKTAEKTGSFILSGQAGKKGMKEPSSIKKYSGAKTLQKTPPSYVKVGKSTVELANLISDLWLAAGLKDWDWTSKFTWQNCDEIAAKFSKRGVTDLSEYKRYIAGALDHWSWMRACMEYRYSSHESNFLRPSALALAHQFDRLVDKLDEKWAPKATKVSSGFFDKGF